MIQCGHCGSEHGTVAEVRSCAVDHPDAGAADHGRFDDGPIDDGPIDDGQIDDGSIDDGPIDDGRRGRRTDGRWRGGRLEDGGLWQPAAAPPVAAAGAAMPASLDVEPAELAGPDELGRSLLTAASRPVPAPWASAERVVVDTARVDDATVARLQAAWIGRRRLTIELVGELPEEAPVVDRQWWELAPDTELGDERLLHLLTANAVDVRGDRPSFGPVQRALAAGATLGGSADVVTPDGEAVWCDGGPLTTFPGLSVVPAAHLERGRLTPLIHAEPTADLAPDQLAAVAHRGGGTRIIAPAGSGKTRVLTERARHLIRDVHVDPSAICLVAFNVRARAEMEERTTDLPGLEVRTLNSLALAMVNGTGPFRTPAGRNRRLSVVDERDVRRILDDLVPRRQRRAMSDPMAAWIEALTASRLGLLDPEAVERDFGGDVAGFAEVAPRYRDALRRAGAVDFDEQILGAIEVLCTDPEARAVARRACRLLLVDEFQDLTPAHLLLIRLLSAPHHDVFGVGDDDQTIYGYSGADPEWLIRFDHYFPGSASHDLTVNYRCPPEVVDAAANLLTHNRRRVDKAIAARPGRPAGDGLRVAVGGDTAATLTRHVRSLVDAGTRPADIAVLTRVNATLLAPMIALGEAGIAVERPIGEHFLDRTGVAGALAWLRVATAPERRLPATDLETAARRPPRGLSQRLAGWIGEQSSPAALTALAGRLRDERDQQKVTDLRHDVERLRAMAEAGGTTEELLVAVRDEIGLGGALDNRLDASRRSVDRSAHGDDLAALLSIARFQPEPERFPGWLRSRIRDTADDPEGVRLATVHRVKGREWPHVVVFEASAGLVPHRLATDREEERRVFHVGLTRCSESVLVVGGDLPSPFIAQLAERRAADSPPEPRSVRAPAPAAGRTKRGIPDAASPEEDSLRDRLRAWRLERARADGVPAYVVFTDATLAELASRLPRDRPQLLAVPGIGPAKVDRYGDDILGVLGT